MTDLTGLGKLLVLCGVILAVVGLLFLLGGKGFLSWFGRLPGDFSWRGRNFTFYFPLATSLLVSVILSLLLYFLNRK
jgi:membrane protein implicated in regulation of membrane protease activity